MSLQLRSRKRTRPGRLHPLRGQRFESLEARHVFDSTIVFSEIMYNPAGVDETLEWVELHNQMAVDVDLTGWRLDSGIQFNFPAGTVLRGGGYLVIAASPDALQQAQGIQGVLGPYQGNLANGGETLELRNHTNRLINEVTYDDEGDWPVGADGSGASIAKMKAQQASHLAENWGLSGQVGGTPGRINFPEGNTVEQTSIMPIGATWRYNQSGTDLGTAWRATDYDDAAWQSGPAVLYVETAELPAPKQTALTLGRTTYYFRTTFQFNGDATNAALRFNHLIDDGAVFYLNGQEVTRFNMPTGNVTAATLANVGVGDAAFTLSPSISASLLLQGQNTLAVEVHQSAANSSDIVFGTEVLLERTIINTAAAPPVVELSEVTAANAGPFWIEIKNRTDQAQSLNQYQMHVVGSVERQFAIPAQTIPAGGYVTFDAATLGFTPTAGDRLFLLASNGGRVIDGVAVATRPQARATTLENRWQTPALLTPAAANQFDLHDQIVINEVMYKSRPSYATDAVIQPTTIVPLNATWRYDDTAVDRGTDWRNPGYNDLAWTSGSGLFYNETAPLPGPKSTLLTLGRPTYYFRTTFEVSGNPADTLLSFSHVVDDGAVFYINGTEFGRFNMPAGAVTYNTLATPAVGDAVLIGPLSIPSHLLVSGTNTLAVELHQNASFSPDVVFGAEVQSLAVITPAIEFAESDEEWIELYNRSNQTIDLSNWAIRDAVNFDFPPATSLAPGEYVIVAGNTAALAAKHPGIRIVGQFSGTLSDKDERISLRDGIGNIADEVHYFDGGSWPRFADGGGSSMELKSPHADNSVPEAWAGSNERSRSEWQHVSYTTTIAPIVHDPPINFHEFVMGLLAAGEVWIDNISVVENPGGDRRQLIQNGTFDADTAGAAASKWRIQGTHERSRVINDPDRPGNKVLSLVADARINYLSNHAETTLANGAQVVNGRTYEISFDAKWIEGSPQLHTELYYKDAARTTILPQAAISGTPGRVNSTFVENQGPTYSQLAHSPVVPTASDPVSVRIRPEDSNGVDALTLFYAVDGAGAFVSVPMTQQSDGAYVGVIPPQANGRVVQFYVQGRDQLGATSLYPPAGPQSRALYKVNNAFNRDPLRHDFQIIMTPADVTSLHTVTNMMNNDRTSSTVIYDGSEVYYNVGVRMRGSMFTRQNAASTGYNVRFNAEQPFRGVHETIAFDQNGETEILSKFLVTQSGHLGGTYDDIMNLVSPSGQGGGPSLAYLARHDDVFFDEQFEDGSEGTMYKFEGIRVMTSTVDGTPEGLKIYQPIGWVANFDIQDLGNSKELYRWPFLINRRRDKDDYGPMISVAKAFSLTGDALHNAVSEVMDVSNLTQTFALMSLLGIGDVYSQGNPHNLNFYVRPEDGKVLVFPWDWDFTFNNAANAPLHGNQNIGKILDLPHYSHFLMGQMDHLMNTVFNRTYMSRWTAHYGTLLGAGFNGLLNNIDARNTFVRSQLPAAVAFDAVTAPTSIDAPTAVVSGRGWVNVKEIRLAGSDTPLSVKWTSTTAWEATVPLLPGVNNLTLEAYNFGGNLIASDTLSITSVSPRPVLDYLRFSEIMYHPAPPSTSESAAGFAEDDFEFVEVTNISPSVGGTTISLAGVTISDGVTVAFGNVQLAPGEYGVIVENEAAFRARYGNGPRIVGQFAAGRLSNAGESLTLVDGAGVTVTSVAYRDSGLWSESADGIGASLELRPGAYTPQTPLEKHYAWQGSLRSGGSPGQVASLRPGVIISEVLANTDDTSASSPGDAIELLNTTTTPMDLSGWWLSDSGDILRKYQIPAGTILAPGGFFVVDERQLNPTPATPAPNHFSLSGAGDDVWLTAVDATSQATLFVDEVHFAGSFSGLSLGRADIAKPHLVVQSRTTLGCTSRGYENSDVIVSELQYAAGAPSAAAIAAAPTLVSDDLEFVELANTTLATVDISGWRIDGGIEYEFPAGTTIGPNQTLLVISFNPTDPLNANRLNGFRTHYGLPATAAIVGGYAGELADAGDVIEVHQADGALPNDPTSTSLVVVDRVVYDNLSPWATGAFGTGASLQRKSPLLFADTATSWNGATPTPGLTAFRSDILGDANGDGRVDALDIDRLFDAIARSRNNVLYDLNRDSRVDQQDVQTLITSVLGSSFGDANLDGSVDATDFAAWNSHRYSNCTSWSAGDFNGDATTDGSDFALWNNAKFSALPSAPANTNRERTPRAAGAVSPLARNDMEQIRRRSRVQAASPANIARRNASISSAQADRATDAIFAGWRVLR